MSCYHHINKNCAFYVEFLFFLALKGLATRVSLHRNMLFNFYILILYTDELAGLTELISISVQVFEKMLGALCELKT